MGVKRSHNRDSVRVFTYNVVFEPGATQEDILDYSGIKRIIEMGIEGFSCTAFCYGQTGSGKTHTLTGPPDLVWIYQFKLQVSISILFFFLQLSLVCGQTQSQGSAPWSHLPLVCVPLPVD